jgi:carbonic anhydrase
MRSSAAGTALEALIEGNRRFAAGASAHPHDDPGRRSEVAKGQHPRAAIVACSDSRVGPEIVFDQGLGDVFVVRTAGNLLDAIGIGSLEYAAARLGVPLIVVMGHSRCGAVGAAAEASAAPGRIPAIVSALEPSIEKAKGAPGDLVDAASRENVKSTVAMLERCEPVIKGLIDEGKLRVVGMFYDIERGTVELLSAEG